MNSFLKKYFSSLENLKQEKLSGDGGHRKYTRLRQNDQTFILMSCGKKDPSLEKFIEIQKRLEPFVSVPRLFQKDMEKGLLLLEDLGGSSLEQIFFTKGKKIGFSFYPQALTQLVCIQDKVKLCKTDTLFDKSFFLEENKMAIHHLQEYINQSCKHTDSLFNDTSSHAFKKDMEKLFLNFKLEDYVYCHRDYHSRNLMVKKDQIVCIDFQDAGSGPWYYDLTSLLYDSYIPLNGVDKKELSCVYFDHLSKNLRKKVQNLSHIELMTKLQFLQRGFKACGCFAAFKNRDKKNTHLKYIPPTLHLLEQEAFELSYHGIYQYIKQLKESIQELSLQ